MADITPLSLEFTDDGRPYVELRDPAGTPVVQISASGAWLKPDAEWIPAADRIGALKVELFDWHVQWIEDAVAAREERRAQTIRRGVAAISEGFGPLARLILAETASDPADDGQRCGRYVVLAEDRGCAAETAYCARTGGPCPWPGARAASDRPCAAEQEGADRG